MTKPKPDRVALAAAQARISEMQQDLVFLRDLRSSLKRKVESIVVRIATLETAIAIEAESVKPRKEP